MYVTLKFTRLMNPLTRLVHVDTRHRRRSHRNALLNTSISPELQTAPMPRAWAFLG